jgi:DNA-binding response OmpR family regulator
VTAKVVDAGANDYLAKPFVTDQLISVMGLWLALSSSN